MMVCTHWVRNNSALLIFSLVRWLGSLTSKSRNVQYVWHFPPVYDGCVGKHTASSESDDYRYSSKSEGKVYRWLAACVLLSTWNRGRG